jgi:hypothetical protein
VFLLFFGRKKFYFLLNNKFTKVKFLELTRVWNNIAKAHIPLSGGVRIIIKHGQKKFATHLQGFA